MSTPDDIIRILDLEPLPGEGGWYRETYRASRRFGDRACSTQIYFLLRAREVSGWHRVTSDEVFHHYGGTAVEQLQLHPESGESRRLMIGGDLEAGERPQVVVPAGWWQGARVLGDHALLGCTVSPGFEWADFELATPDDVQTLARRFPDHDTLVHALSP